jgi:hypothetical protein
MGQRSAILRVSATLSWPRRGPLALERGHRRVAPLDALGQSFFYTRTPAIPINESMRP